MNKINISSEMIKKIEYIKYLERELTQRNGWINDLQWKIKDMKEELEDVNKRIKHLEWVNENLENEIESESWVYLHK